MKLEMALLAGQETKQFLVELSHQIDRLEKVAECLKANTPPKDAEEIEDDDDDEELVKKPAKGKKSFEDDDEDEADSDDDDTDAEDSDDDGDDEEEDDEAPRKPVKGAGKKASFDEDDEDEEEDEPTGYSPDRGKEPKAKAGKKEKKVTLDDCNDAAKALVQSIGKPGREVVLKLMKKHFKVSSVSELKPTDYAKFVKTMNDAKEENE